MTRQNLGIFRAVNTIMMEMSSYICADSECTTSRMNNNATYELWVIIMGQGKFTCSNQYITVVGNVGHKGGYACVGVGRTEEISVPSQFALNLKLLFKKIL